MMACHDGTLRCSAMTNVDFPKWAKYLRDIPPFLCLQLFFYNLHLWYNFEKKWFWIYDFLVSVIIDQKTSNALYAGKLFIYFSDLLNFLMCIQHTMYIVQCIPYISNKVFLFAYHRKVITGKHISDQDRIRKTIR